MSNAFFEKPILNSPYEAPTQYWELDESGQPTQAVMQGRRPAQYIVPIPKTKRQSGATQKSMVFDEGRGISREGDEYDPTPIINRLRLHVENWRIIPSSGAWGVTPETARLLQHWRCHEFSSVRPFFCQIEAVETLIWLTEVAPNTTTGKVFLDHIARANLNSNPDPVRIALKLATGAGKTTVMAMIIAWQTITAVRHPQSKRFTRGFLVVSPGITIKDRLRVLQPNDPDSYYASRELVPTDMLADVNRAKIVITNYHAFKLRERVEISAGGRRLLKGRYGDEINTLETEGQMLQRVMPELMSLKTVLVLNDEAHHCYREKPGDPDEEQLKGDDKREADENKEAARLWISGLEAVKRKLGEARIVERHPQVRSYVKNHGLALEVPYRYGSEARKYLPDFIVRVDDGHGEGDLLNLIVEIKGYRKEDAVTKKTTMDTYWIPGVNNLGQYGSWAFAELTALYDMMPDFEEQLEKDFERMVAGVAGR